MRVLVPTLLKICRLSVAWPRTAIAVFLVLAVAGFSAMPLITLSTNLVAGIGDTDSVIGLTQENNKIFGEQDSLILVLEFPEPPGEARLPFIKGLGEALEKVSGVRRVRYRFLDPKDYDQIAVLFKHFLLGMNARGTTTDPKYIESSGN